ncbi:MAG: hypothetical protein ACRC5S_10410 [Cetobacterium sp.]
MLGLDKAIVNIKNLKIDADQLKTNILKKFELADDIHSNNVDRIYLNSKKNKNPKYSYINYIEIKKVRYEFCSLSIEFNYPRFFKKTNFELVTTQLEKEQVDFAIKLILYEVLGIEINKLSCSYSSLEIAEQMKITKFSDYNNILWLVYRALSNSEVFKNKGNKCMYGDYSTFLKKFYVTGFSFSLEQGLVLKVYNKTLENNKKANWDDEKVYSTELKSEITTTEQNLKMIAKTANMDSLSLPHLKKSVKDKLEKTIKEAIQTQILSDRDEIIKRLKSLERITPTTLQLFVVENNEWIIDYDFFNQILTKEIDGLKSKRSLKDYKKIAKDTLIRIEKSNSPVRSNTKNLKKLEMFLKNLLGITIEIKFTEDGEIQIF